MGRCCSDGQVPLVRASYQALIRREERFAKAAVGRVLRELSLAEPERVARFVENQVEAFSREAMRQAVDKLPDRVEGRLL